MLWTTTLRVGSMLIFNAICEKSIRLRLVREMVILLGK
jgi:hypothetical protein